MKSAIWAVPLSMCILLTVYIYLLSIKIDTEITKRAELVEKYDQLQDDFLKKHNELELEKKESSEMYARLRTCVFESGVYYDSFFRAWRKALPFDERSGEAGKYAMEELTDGALTLNLKPGPDETWIEISRQR